MNHCVKWHTWLIGCVHAMVQLKKDTSDDDPFRRLVQEKKAEWQGLRGLLKAAEIAIDKEVYVSQWLKGKLDKKRKSYFPPLKGETREKLFAFLKDRYPNEVAEIKNAEINALLEKASKIGRRVRTPTELDHFAEFVRNGAIITDVSAHSVTAEGYETTRSYKPREGLTEEVYERLVSDDLVIDTQEELAWGVIENLLRKKGLTAEQIGQARRRVSEAWISDLVDESSFEVVANALCTDVKKAPKRKRR